MPGYGQIVLFTGRGSNDYPQVGPHLEVATLDGRIFQGGGWVYRLFQFISPPTAAPLPPVVDEEVVEIVRGFSREMRRWVETGPVSRETISPLQAEGLADAIDVVLCALLGK